MNNSSKKKRVLRLVAGLLLITTGIVVAIIFAPNWGDPQLTRELVINFLMFFVGLFVAVVGGNLVFSFYEDFF